MIIVCGDEVKKGKPDPEIFLEVSKKLGVKPCNTYVLEDSENGIIAAHQAGMIPINIPDIKAPSAQIYARAHLIARDLNEVLSFFKSKSS